MDWRDLAGRILMWDYEGSYASRSRTAGDRFLKTLTLTWGELRDSYFEALRRVALPILEFFPTGRSASPSEWLTRERVEREFAKFKVATARLFED
jgi:hypothetical protein